MIRPILTEVRAQRTFGQVELDSTVVGADFSERLYGRFGEFFPWDLRRDNPLSVRYRWWVRNGRDVTREAVEEKYADLAEPPKVSLKK